MLALTYSAHKEPSKHLPC